MYWHAIASSHPKVCPGAVVVVVVVAPPPPLDDSFIRVVARRNNAISFTYTEPRCIPDPESATTSNIITAESGSHGCCGRCTTTIIFGSSSSSYFSIPSPTSKVSDCYYSSFPVEHPRHPPRSNPRDQSLSPSRSGQILIVDASAYSSVVCDRLE